MIIVGVLANDEGGYASMVQACRETCYKEENIPEDVKVFYLYGNRKNVKIPFGASGIDKDCFYFGFPEGRQNLLYKTIAFYEYCYNNFDFEYIFRTNCGSYVNLPLLESFAKEQKKEGLYLGIKTSNQQGFDHEYASGSGFLLSKDLIKLLIDNKNKLEYNGNTCMDDNAIGKFLVKDNEYKVAPGALRKDLFLNEITEQTIDDVCYHYYFRHSIEPKCLYETEKIIQKKRKA